MYNIFNSGFMTKFLFFALAGMCIWLLQLKVEYLQAQNRQKESQIANLQQTLASQENAMQRLVHEYEKQEQQLIAYEQQKQVLERKIRAKKQALIKNEDEASRAWKDETIPLPILAILQGQKLP